jgi:hypothetical protein
MERNVSGNSAANAARGGRLFGYPDECPRCHHRIVPKLLATVSCGTESVGNFEEVFQCTNQGCEGLFIATYVILSTNDSPYRFELTRTQPVAPSEPSLPDTVRELSPTFVETYTQALAAEAHNLRQLTGIGLRKALEFLVKDLAVHLSPGDEENVRKKQLAACIADHLGDPNLKATAKRAAWLGNDEAHYVRRWEDKDISDLKVLIRLTINWADNVLLTHRYSTEMPD